MYSMDELGANLMLSPASGNQFYHNSYEGGYIDHVMNVSEKFTTYDETLQRTKHSLESLTLNKKNCVKTLIPSRL